MYPHELPPTPSSSAFSFLTSDQREPEKCSLEQASSSASTISPNDDDEGLYLLWTHQLLREKGFNPSSCRLDDDDDDDGNESVDSSITDLSTNDATSTTLDQNPSFFKFLSRKQQQRRQTNSQSSSWFACFPMC
ncbi:hypothetical protein K501DRAFT_188992 [Backusella circina FSU 941]|nr:hypothetical protein K501DRAFT_188992 [Backusella circina FSU 941]